MKGHAGVVSDQFGAIVAMGFLDESVAQVSPGKDNKMGGIHYSNVSASAHAGRGYLVQILNRGWPECLGLFSR